MFKMSKTDDSGEPERGPVKGALGPPLFYHLAGGAAGGDKGCEGTTLDEVLACEGDLGTIEKASWGAEDIRDDGGKKARSCPLILYS